MFQKGRGHCFCVYKFKKNPGNIRKVKGLPKDSSGA